MNVRVMLILSYSLSTNIIQDPDCHVIQLQIILNILFHKMGVQSLFSISLLYNLCTSMYVSIC